MGGNTAARSSDCSKHQSIGLTGSLLKVTARVGLFVGKGQKAIEVLVVARDFVLVPEVSGKRLLDKLLVWLVEHDMIV